MRSRPLYSAAIWTEKEDDCAGLIPERNNGSTGAPRRARTCPVVPGSAAQAEPIPTTNPHAQVTKMAFAWSKDQTPSNYYLGKLGSSGPLL